MESVNIDSVNSVPFFYLDTSPILDYGQNDFLPALNNDSALISGGRYYRLC
jgi:hypothetical protein